MNEKVVHTFENGMKSDLDNHIKTKNSFVFGENGRLSAKDGTLSFVTTKGTEEILNDSRIVKYLGAESFNDQLIIFVKASGVDINIGGVIYESVNVNVPSISDFEIELTAGVFDFTDEISDNSSVVTYSEQIASPAPTSEVVINDNYDPEGTQNETIDLDTYYETNVNVPDFSACQVQSGSIPENNVDFSDCIISITKDENNVFTSKIIWAGYQNWDINSKIVALGVDENSNYRRIKYTDFKTPFKSINVYDAALAKRSSEELENFQTTTLLQPRIKEVNDNGQLRSMSSQYTYRLITENGQVTDFSPFSKVQFIYPENNTAIEGGSIGEATNKSVRVICNILKPTGFAEIECVALEFEARGIPSGFKSLGIKPVSSVVEFDHFGNESDLGTEITVSDTLQTSANWKYCSDLETKNNKLFAFGLRTNPISNDYERLKALFALHGWNPSNGSTHESFLNPDPKTFNSIPPNFTNPFFYVKKRVYEQIRSFGNTDVSIINTDTGDEIVATISNEENIYKDVTEIVSDFLLDTQSNDTDFTTFFPNLEIDYLENVILFKPIDENIETDFSVYELQFSNSQVLFDLNDENIFDTGPYNAEQFVHGAMSAGFNSGTGIRLTYRLVYDELLNKSNSLYSGSGSVIDIIEPNFKKGFMKNEIYRLSIQVYQNGERIFAIPMGDLHIPEMGETYSYLNDSGNIVVTSDKYTNQVVIGNKLYGVRVEMHVDIRFDCNFSKKYDSYQLLYVERDENNRTILCQGVSAPLIRVQDPLDFLNYEISENLQRKWTLPYHGGPIYDKEGFDQYDANGEDYDNPNYEELQRVINNRKLFYFDSPELIYQKISGSLIPNSNVRIVGRLNTDHDNDTIMTSGENIGGFPQPTFPKFSNKILRSQLNAPSIISDVPKLVGDENADNSTWQTHFTNVSVYPFFTHFNIPHSIEGASELLRGEILPGSEFGTSFEVSNNAFCLPSMPWWYSNEVRKIRREDDQHGFEAYTRGSSLSLGEKTFIIKTENNAFSNAFIGPSKPVTFPTQIRRGGSSFNYYDSKALINIERNNADSVYGGRNEQAFSKNIFIPLSETKPIDTATNGAQSFNVEGDSYVTLWPRTKNSHGNESQQEIDRELNNGRTSTAANRGDLQDVKKLNNAWCYAVVIETTVEPKLNDEYEFYRETSGIDFSIIKNEVLNSAYLHTNNYRKYIPRPFRFQDDPNFDNVVAASETKLSGEYYDSWSSFPVNEFQELDKNKGAVLNAAKIKDEIFAIQERQTSLLYVDRNTFVPTENGDTINVKQGSGKTIDGYRVESNYGTSIRRSLVKHEKFGFMFIDDVKKVIVKNLDELTLKNQYHHSFYNKLNTEKLIDVNGFFDEEFKESCLNIVTDSGNSMIMYNEALQVLSGWREMNSSIYMPFDGKIYIPRETVVTVNEIDRPSAQSLHELNKGLYLNVLENELKMKISFVCAPMPDETFIFPHIAWVLNDFSDFESITITTKEGLRRQLLPTHGRYKKREGKHTIPTLNYFSTGDDSDEKKDIRSEWALFEFVFPHNEGTLRKLNRVVNYIRLSYQ